MDIFPPLWAALLGVSAVALAWVGTWRRRLGYEVEGLDHIGGSWQQNHREGPFIACRVVIKMRDGATESEQRAVVAALKILVATVNEDLESDKDCRDAKRWTFVSESVVEGEGTLGLYRTGMLRRWLSGPMRRAVIAGGVIGVSVNARYTGESFRIK